MVRLTPAFVEPAELADEKWSINPLNVVLVRPVGEVDGDATGGLKKYAQILFVNSAGQQSSIVVKETVGEVETQLNGGLRGL